MRELYIKINLFGLVSLCTLLSAFAQPAIHGTTPFGGSNGIGKFFTTAIDGTNYQTIFDFESTGTEAYGDLLEVSPGKFYGMTTKYGGTNSGVIFEYNAVALTYTEKFVFGGENGISPHGGLIKATNGKLYGVTNSGGANLAGVLFEYDYVNNIYTKKIDLNLTIGGYASSSLYEATNGLLYGLAQGGGINNNGTLFEYNPTTNVFTKKVDFDDVNNGSSPAGGLIEVNGKLYGFTSQGGTQIGGTFFEYDISSGILTTKQDLSNVHPRGTPLLASDGKIYGVTTYGGTSLLGTIYEYDPTTSIYTVKANLADTDLYYGVGSLVETTPGKLYGKTSGGGATGYGGIFEYDIATSTLTKKFDFTIALGYQGHSSSFILGLDGALYGQQPAGGEVNGGVIYKFETATSAYTKLHDFGLGDDKVYFPRDFVETSSGRVFGVSSRGGSNTLGTLFEYDFVTQQVIKKIDFESFTSGEHAYSILEGSNGKLYGRAYKGGATNRGVLFEYDIETETFTKRLDLSSSIGAGEGGMIEVAGKLYLITNYGATSNLGSLIVFDLATNLVTTINHMASIGGFSAYGSPVLASNGKLYGTTTRDLNADQGVLYEYNITTDVLTKKHDFVLATGGKSYSTLVEGAPNKLYGLAKEGGANSVGVIFEYDVSTDTYTDKFDFDGLTLGGIPTGSFVKSSNGMLYGMTSTGGANGFGTYFEYNPATNAVLVRKNLIEKTTEARNPASFIEVCSKPKHANFTDIEQCAGTALTIDLSSPNTDSYVWKKGGDVIAGQTSGSISFTSLQSTDAGQYTAEMTNACGTSIIDIEVGVSDITNAITSANVTCNDNADGSIEILTSGGFTDYEYSIGGGSFGASNSFTNLSGGDYTVITRDAIGCEVSDQITIINPATLTLSAFFDGQVALTATGGTAPYQYSSDNTTFQSESTFTLPNGEYTFTVRDANDCEATTDQALLVTAIDGNFSRSKIVIYPNPVASTIHLSGLSGKSVIQLIDNTGRLVLSRTNHASTEVLDVDGLKKGVYVLKIGDTTKRILIQ